MGTELETVLNGKPTGFSQYLQRGEYRGEYDKHTLKGSRKAYRESLQCTCARRLWEMPGLCYTQVLSPKKFYWKRCRYC